MTNPYVVRGGIQARVGNGAAGAAHGAAEAATEDPEIFFYEFMGTAFLLYAINMSHGFTFG